MKALLGKLSYGALFTLLWPGALAWLAVRLDASGFAWWRVPVPAWAGVAITTAGVVLMLVSMHALWRLGKGLPMNAYPPTEFVASSSYALFSHPIYVGFVLSVAGVSVWANSPAGLWVLTPVAALSAAALVLGYEGPMLRRRFGPRPDSPWFALPAMQPGKPPWPRRFAAATIALLPWALAYAAFSAMPAPQAAIELRMAWEESLPRPAWAVWVYSLAYLWVVLSPLAADSWALLRRFVVASWLGSFTGFLLMLTVPGRAALLDGAYDGLTAWLMQGNRALDADWLAHPSFHVFWTVLAACLLSHRVPRWRWAWAAFAVVMAASCVLTGSHAVVDVAGGAVLGLGCWHHDALWQRVLALVERLGNSWTALRRGPVRVISHAWWSFAGAAAGTLLVLHLAGPQAWTACAIVVSAGLLSAGAWGYWLEGGHRLSRPFGYYGFLFGSLGALALLGAAGVAGTGTLAAAFAVAAPLAQGIGRLRCVVQGCCHGRPVLTARGIRIRNRFSRVTALSSLVDVPIHPAQVYSMAANAVVFLVLLRLWIVGAPWTLIGGLFLVLSSLARFVEEQYRGEAQTAYRHGLSVYQWLAAGLFVAGLGVMALHAAPVKHAAWISPSAMALALAAGLAAAVLMSVDFPASKRRFSRLTVAEG